jgi:hypothetical protein
MRGLSRLVALASIGGRSPAVAFSGLFWRRPVGTNYLDAEEINTLDRITVLFLDQAEFCARRRRDIHRAD